MRIFVGTELQPGKKYRLLRTKQKRVEVNSVHIATKVTGVYAEGEARQVVNPETGGVFYANETDVFESAE